MERRSRENHPNEQKNLQEKAAEVSRFAEQLTKDEPTVAPAARLFLFAKGTLTQQREGRAPLPDEQDRWQKKIARMVEEEQWYRQAQVLPTIGIEIELPKSVINTQKQDILNALHIPAGTEPSFPGLYEVNPDFTYSALPQARILQSMDDLNMLPVDRDGRIPTRSMLSLHVNFGIPAKLDDRSKVFENMRQRGLQAMTLANAFVVGFSNPDRILKRKTREAVKVKPTHRDYKKGYVKIHSPSLHRLEIRPAEFRDYPTYRLLIEGQRVTAALFASVAKHYELALSPTEELLSETWNTFEREVRQAFLAKRITIEDIDHADDRNHQRVWAAMVQGDVSDTVRKSIHQCSARVAKILELPTVRKPEIEQ